MVSLVIMNWETWAYLINDVAHPTYALQQDLLSWLWNYTFNCCLFRIFRWFFTSVSNITCSELNLRSSVRRASPSLFLCSVPRGTSLHPVGQIRMSGPSLNVSFSVPCIQPIFQCDCNCLGYPAQLTAHWLPHPTPQSAFQLWPWPW